MSRMADEGARVASQVAEGTGSHVVQAQPFSLHFHDFIILSLTLPTSPSIDTAAEAKRDADLADQAEKRRLAQEAINRSRQAQIDRKAQLKAAEEEEKARFSAQWATIQAQLEREEAEAKEQRRLESLALQATILRQAQEKQAAAAASRSRHRADESEAAAKASVGDAEFQALADKCVHALLTPIHFA